MDEYIVYIKINEQNQVTEITSSAFLQDNAGYIEIDKGEGDKFHHAQGNYLEKSLFSAEYAHNYICENGKLREATQNEKDIEIAARPQPAPSESERIDAVEAAMLAIMGGMQNV